MFIADARVKKSEFTRSLIQQGYLEPCLYVRDKHYREYGFAFIGSMSQAHAFLDALDRAPKRTRLGVDYCHKALSIRTALSNESTTNHFTELERFFIYAASARRVHCQCHEVGSYHAIHGYTQDPL